jgi:hypothetical protein
MLVTRYSVLQVEVQSTIITYNDKTSCNSPRLAAILTRRLELILYRGTVSLFLPKPCRAPTGIRSIYRAK